MKFFDKHAPHLSGLLRQRITGLLTDIGLEVELVCEKPLPRRESASRSRLSFFGGTSDPIQIDTAERAEAEFDRYINGGHDQGLDKPLLWWKVRVLDLSPQQCCNLPAYRETSQSTLDLRYWPVGI